MFNRRTVTGLLAGTAMAPGTALRAADSSIPLYDGIGPDLSVYGLDTATGALALRAKTVLPSNVQYAWPDPSRKFLYVVSSNMMPAGSNMPAGPDKGGHMASAFRVAADGTLTPHGKPVALHWRPVHASVDHSGRYLLVAHNLPSAITVYRINPDKTLGAEVKQTQALDVGIYGHQVRATPSNKTVTLVTRGNNPTPAKPEDPGAIKVFRFSEDGQLSNLQSLVPAGTKGYGFGPRHLDFHPALPFVYVSLERENRLDVYRLNPDGSLSDQALFKVSTLDRPDQFKGGGAGPIHIHPNGRFVYVTNRGALTVDYKDQKVSNGGLNSVAVFAIDQATGEPRLIQNAEGHGFELRTFVIDPGGKLLVAASQAPMLVREGDNVRNVSAGLSIYRLGSDGKLTFLRKQDVDTSAGTQFWAGLLTMP